MRTSNKYVTYFLLILSLICFLLVPSIKAYTETSIINGDSDDASIRRQSVEWFGTTSWLHMGDYDSSNYDYETGLRFTNVDVPQGAIIQSAYIELTVLAIYGNDPDIYIDGEDANTAYGFTSAFNYKARNRTTAQVVWYPTGWGVQSEQQTSDIGSVVQEIVNRVGWSANNSMGFFLQDASGWNGSEARALAYAYDMNNNYAPELHITWSDPLNPTIGNVTKLSGVGYQGVSPYVNIQWEYTGNVTNYEIIHSTDNVTFSTVGYSAIKEYNHTGLTNNSYHYYRVRSTYFNSTWWNSSFSNIDLEKTSYEISSGSTGYGIEIVILFAAVTGLMMGRFM